MSHERSEIHRRVGEPSADHDICTGIERRNYGVGAQISIHADDFVFDRRDRPGLIHKRLVGGDEATDVIAFDASNLET